jgi:hypothetical protein
MTARQEKLAMGVFDQLRRSKDPSNKRLFDVDYDQPFFDVCQQFLKFVLPKSGDLDILLRPWSPKITPKKRDDIVLPSWIPTLDRTAHAPQRTKVTAGSFKMGRRNADPLVGQPGPGKRLYDASKRKATRDDWRFSDPLTEHSHSLFIRGFVLDRIGEVKPSALKGAIPESWLGLSEWDARRAGYDATVDPPPDRLWRTLVADRDARGLNPPIYYRTACQFAVSHSVDGDGVQTQTLIDHGGSSITTEFLQRVQSVIWNRRMFKLKTLGLLGLAPERAEQGDGKSVS